MTQTLQRELDLDAVVLAKGAHKPDGEFCVMEAVAYVAGEPWTDHPACACPIISAFLRKWNDDMGDADRQMLRTYIPRLVGTKATKKVEQRRGWMLTDWMIRVHTPAWLDLAGLKDQADALRVLAEIADFDGLKLSQSKLDEAKEKADAALGAARDAAYDAARGAALDAAYDAALDAAYDAARGAALGAAYDAAYDAVRGAALGAATKNLTPTKVALQASALELLDRMIACQ